MRAVRERMRMTSKRRATSTGAPGIHENTGRRGIGYSVKIAGGDVILRVFDCNEPIDGGARCVKASEGDGGGEREKGEQQWEERDAREHERRGYGSEFR